MCDVSGRLLAWMDGELAENDHAAVKQHVQTCEECKGRVAAYEDVSRRFGAYCNAVLRTSTGMTAATTKPRRRISRWAPVLVAAAVAAVLVVALLPRSAKPMPVAPQVAETRPAITVETPATPLKRVQRRHVAAHPKTPGSNWAMAEPAIQIAIPADAMFPPGAVPEGVTFVANLSLTTDGSVQGIRLQP